MISRDTVFTNISLPTDFVDLGKRNLNLDIKVIHYTLSSAYQVQDCRSLESIPAVTGRVAAYILEASPVCRRANTGNHTLYHSHLPPI